MGAKAEDDLGMNYLAVLQSLWEVHPGIYQVRAEPDDLFPTLAHLCIKWLAASGRELIKLGRTRTDTPPPPVRGVSIQYRGGFVPSHDSRRQMRNHHLRPVLNRIVHGDPTWVQVDQGGVILYFERDRPLDEADEDEHNDPYIAWYTGDSVLAALRHALRSEEPRLDQRGQLLVMIERLGVDRFLPHGPP